MEDEDEQEEEKKEGEEGEEEQKEGEETEEEHHEPGKIIRGFYYGKTEKFWVSMVGCFGVALHAREYLI